MAVCAVLAASCTGARTPSLDRSAVDFPLKVGPTGRYLVDGRGKPFLVVGDAPQALMVNLTTAEAESYLSDRKAHGFNAVWINLLCADYTGGRPDAGTIDGLKPFARTNDFATPNEAYFAHCDGVVRCAAKHGITVFLDPAETGSFLKVMRSNGPEKCRAFGRYLGRRYRSFDNIVWMSGNDFQTWKTPADDDVVTAVALGIKDLDKRHIHTVELDYDLSSSYNDPNWARIASLNAAYTYFPTYAEVLRDYALRPAVPVFMVESDYEFENGADTGRLRREEYWAYLSGACGVLYGNGYVWPFKAGWQSKLDTVGVEQLGYCKALLTAVPWHDLVPDASHRVLISGYGTFDSGGSAHGGISSNDYVACAATLDGKWMLAYLPKARTVTVDMARLTGAVQGRWFDPTNGRYSPVAAESLSNSGLRPFSPPAANSAGASDWVLVLHAR